MYSMVTKKERKEKRGREKERKKGRKRERKIANLLFFSFLAFLGFSSKSPQKQTLVLEKKTELAVFQVWGKNVKNVEDALLWIQDLIRKEQFPY